MFQHYSPQMNQHIKQKTKVIAFMQNGHPERIFSMQINNKKGLSKQQIFKAAEKNWCSLQPASENSLNSSQYQNNANGLHQSNNGRSQSELNIFIHSNFCLKSMRIFSIEAVQYFDQDLQFLKNGDRLYISKGQQFDSNRNFGQYEIIRKLGEGGFGSVDLARNIITNEYAAIKIVKPDKNSGGSQIDMIFKEAQNLKALSHPNIVKIINCYTLNDMRVVIVMEYLEGGQLLQLLKKQKNEYFSQKQAKVYFKQIISGVSYCHKRGIIHRDLKLQNILIKNKQNSQDNGVKQKQVKTIKIADFGISGVANRFNPDADWGTLRYMPPEVLSGKTKTNSSAVDIWACGIILYQMVTGQFPFDGKSSTQIMESIIKKPLQFPNKILLTIKCKNLLRSLLQKNPSSRITISDIENDPWVDSNIAYMALPKDGQQVPTHIKTLGSQNILGHDSKLNFYTCSQYDAEDLERIKPIDPKNKQRKSCSKQIRQIIGDKQRNMNKRKSINFPKHINDNPAIKIPKRLQKQKDQIIEQLRNYRNYNFKQRQKPKQRERSKEKPRDKSKQKEKVQGHQYRGGAHQDKQLFPVINRKANRYNANINYKLLRDKQKNSQLNCVGSVSQAPNNLLDFNS